MKPTWVRRRRDGTIELRLDPDERELLGGIVDQLRDLLLADSDDPVAARLFPPAYPDDAEKEAGFQALARGELLESRLAALDVVDATLASGVDVLSEEEASAWLRSLNGLRLVLGTRLDVGEEDDPRRYDRSDPEAPRWLLYELLSHFVDELVTALGPG